jgi:hypothetical protein
MINNYFKNEEVLDDFEKEFITLWSGWLGRDEFHKLDEVTYEQWDRFNTLLRSLDKKYDLYLVNKEYTEYKKVENIESIIDSYDYSMSKDSCHFTTIIIPELEIIYEEAWDYTWILWHKNRNSNEAFKKIVIDAKLCQFNEKKNNT